MSFADELKAARKRLALTQVEMAALLDIPARVYWDMEQGVEHYAITREGGRARISATGRRRGWGCAENASDENRLEEMNDTLCREAGQKDAR